jgi:hypothetical protein
MTAFSCTGEGVIIGGFKGTAGKGGGRVRAGGPVTPGARLTGGLGMAGTYPQEGRIAVLYVLGYTGGSNYTVRLFQNTFTQADTIGLADLVEADYDGYTPYQGSSWAPPAIDTNGDGFTLSPQIVFTRIAGAKTNDIYGYFITVIGPNSETRLLMYEQFANPVPMHVVTDQVPLRIKLTDRNVTY